MNAIHSYVITVRAHAPEITAVLREHGAEAHVRAVEPGEGPAALPEAARVPSDLLILDTDTGPGLGGALIAYRLARPDTRVVLMAVGRKPGDPEVAAAVAAGVYDVLTHVDGLPGALDRPPAPFQQAAMWLDPRLDPDASQQAAVVREKVVERRVAVSSRPVFIALAGVCAGAGTTTVAAAVAAYLARLGHRVALVEAGAPPTLGVVANLSAGPAQWVPGLDVLPDVSPDAARDLVRLRSHPYVIADLGVPPRAELLRIDADLILIVLPPAHRLMRLQDWLIPLHASARLEDLDETHYRDRDAAWRTPLPPHARYVSLAAPEAQLVSEALIHRCAAAGRDDTPVSAHCHVLPLRRPDRLSAWPPGYRHADQALDDALARLLADVLPDRPGRPRRPLSLLSFWRRRRTSFEDPGKEGATDAMV